MNFWNAVDSWSTKCLCLYDVEILQFFLSVEHQLTKMRVQETFRKLSHLRFSTAKYFSSKPKHESYDAVIVGGGHNGLVAAAYLSKSGLKYVVLDLIVSYSLHILCDISGPAF